MSAYSDRCEREDEEDRLAIYKRLRDAREQARYDNAIAADKAASPFFSASTYREDYRYS